ncbi:MAG TPA: hypothetical protein VGU20_23935 [Stellaceae bacterium]|nr:hypothetical protein [Stellaceae bacterium]
MRFTFPLLACALLAACGGSREVTSTPPTVSYQVRGNDVSQTNVQAQNYCARYDRAAIFQGVQPSSSGNLAVYSCEGPAASATAPAPLAGTTVGPPTPLNAGVQCADALHQDRPGGSDYHGPPVVGCPQR